MGKEKLGNLLAEKVMGWKPGQCTVCYKAEHVKWDDPSGDFVMFQDKWHPTTSLEQAFMVAEKIGNLELIQVKTSSGDRWKAGLGDLTGYSRASTPQLAICLAAKAYADSRK